MDRIFVSLFILWLSIFISPTTERLHSQESTDSSDEGLSLETDSKQLFIESREKYKKPYKNQGPLFDFTGNLRKKFAFELLLSNGIQNMACSPISALMPLGKLAIGAEGQSETELLNAIGVSKKSEIKKMFQNTIHELKYLPGVKLNVASRIYISDKVKIKKKFKKEIRKIFKTSLTKVNFENSKETENIINSWVAKESGKSTKLNIDYKVSGIKSAVLVNIVTFVGNWEKKFRKVTSHDFHSPTGVVSVPMMHHRSTYNHVKSDVLKAQVIDIPYEEENASFVVVLPVAKNGLQVLLKQLKLAPELLNDAMKNMTKEHVVLSLPKFKIQFKQDLKPIYKSVGLDGIFSAKSGLTGIIKDQELSVAGAYQVTIIDVNEIGTEAAAATVVEIVGLSMPMHQVVFNADHPFLFYVKSTNEQLFAGVYAGR